MSGALRDTKDDAKLAVIGMAWNPKRRVLAFCGDDADRAMKLDKDVRGNGYRGDSMVRDHQGLIGVCSPSVSSR